MDRVVTGVRLWRARRELAELMVKIPGGRTDRSDLLAACMEILEGCPQLAGERFAHYRLSNKMKIYPISFFLINNASLEDIQKVYPYHPEAVHHKVTKKSAATDYPLHLACIQTGVSEELILFLAGAYPKALTTKNSSGSLPIHVLLRNRHHAFTKHEIKTLMDHYVIEKIRGPTEAADCRKASYKGDWREGNTDFGAILSLAIRNDKVDTDILDLLVSRFPATNCDAFYLGRVTQDFSVGFFLRQNTNYTLTEPRVGSLCNLLPHLRVFSCTPKNWSTSGFLVFMAMLCQNESLKEVTLSFPPTLLWGDDSPSRALQQVLVENSSLQQLHVDFPSVCKDMNVRDVANAGFKDCLDLFLEGLRCNNTLIKVEISGDLVSFLDSDYRCSEFWPGLVHVLRSQNTTLESILAASLQHDNALKDVQKVDYWTRLNRYGRARLRDPSVSIHKVVAMLAAAQESLAREKHSHSFKTVGLLYGILLDSPSIWASVATR